MDSFSILSLFFLYFKNFITIKKSHDWWTVLVSKRTADRSHANQSQGFRSPISDTIFRFTEVRDVTNREDVSQAAIYEAQHAEDSMA